jgi:hypothetical protein
MSFARDSVIPTNARNVLSIPHKDARIMDVSMTFRPSLLFKFRSTPAVFDGLKVHFGVSLFVLDPNGHQIKTYLPLGEIWFKEDGTIAQTSGTRATVSLLGKSSGSITWKSTER